MDTNIFNGRSFWIFAAVIIAVVWSIVAYMSPQKPASFEERMMTLKALRDTKAQKLKVIEEEKKAIYIIDQKIIPLKCALFSEAWANIQWKADCETHFEEQQSKIKSPVETPVVEDLTDE